jgi:hypothetical protein
MSERVLKNEDAVMATEPVVYSDKELVTVADFPDPATAQVAQAAMEAAGIPVFLQGENANSLLPIAFGALLQVRPADEAAARAILKDFEVAPESMADVTAAEQAEEKERS